MPSIPPSLGRISSPRLRLQRGGAICARDSSCRRPRSYDEMHVRCASRGTSEEQVSPWPHVSLRLLLPRASYERRHPSRRPRVLCRCLSAVFFPFLSFWAGTFFWQRFCCVFFSSPFSFRRPLTRPSKHLPRN